MSKAAKIAIIITIIIILITVGVVLILASNNSSPNSAYNSANNTDYSAYIPPSQPVEEPVKPRLETIQPVPFVPPPTNTVPVQQTSQPVSSPYVPPPVDTAPVQQTSQPASSPFAALTDSRFSLRGGHNGKLCAGQEDKLICNRDGVGEWEQIILEDAGSGKHAISVNRDGQKYYCAEDTDKKVRCNRTAIGPWESHSIELLPNNTLAFKGGNSGTYCKDDHDGVICGAGALGPWEKYTWQKL